MSAERMTTSNRTTATADPRPGWPEIAIGLGVALAMLAATPLVVLVSPDDAILTGFVLTTWSVVVAFGGFLAAFLIRRRGLAAFGVRRAGWRWIVAAIPLGLLAFGVKGLVNMAVIAAGFADDAQSPYYDTASGGILPLIATLVTLSLLVPIGEEFLFRGVLMRGLLRYGPVLAVVVSTVVFALFHGINLALPTALVFGLFAAEVARRSGSVWPAVIMHVINNLALPVFVLLGGGANA